MLVDRVIPRSAGPADARPVRELALTELGRAPSLRRIEDLLSDYPAVVAWEGTRLVGFVFGSALAPDIVELANLLVAADHRGAGLGTSLVGAFEDQARRDYGAVIVANSALWGAHGRQMPSAVPLYRRLGYRAIYETNNTALLAKEL